MIESKIRHEVNIDERAAADAKAGLPARSATAYTPTENELVNKTREAILADIQRLSAVSDSVAKSCDHCEHVVSHIQAQVQQGEFAAPQDETRLQIARKQMNECTAQYNQFKLSNELQREADEQNLFPQISWAVLVAVIEGVFNSYFFSTASELGLVGGFFQAFVISIINVGFAFIAGALFLPYKNHVNPAKQLGGLVLFLLFFCVCLVMIIFSSLYRGALDELKNDELGAALAGDAWAAAREHFMMFEWQAVFASLDSFLLIFVGLLCAFLGVWKGYKSDDAYPGFSAMLNKKQEAEDKYKVIEQEYQQAVKNQKGQTGQQLNTMIAAVEEAAQEMKVAFNGYETMVQNASPLQQAMTISKNLLTDYRHINQQVRADNPPAYFQQFPSEADFPNINMNWEKHLGIVGQLSARVGELQTQADIVRQLLKKNSLSLKTQ